MNWRVVSCALFIIAANASADPPIKCKLAIAGGGPAGVYSAWRLLTDPATSSNYNAKTAPLCIFERSSRFGGRTFSMRNQGTKKDLVVELGAYRFCGSLDPHNTTGCEMYMPLIASLTKNALKLRVASYEEKGDEDGMVKIVDDEGQNAGLLTYVERMMNTSIALGLQYYSLHQLDDFDVTASSELPLSNSGATANVTFNLNFANGKSATASELLLNLPLQPAMRVLQAARTRKALKPYGKSIGVDPVSSFLHVPMVVRHVKLYVHYDWAWWRNLGLTFGNFNLYGQQGRCGVTPISPCTQEMPLEGTVVISRRLDGTLTYPQYYPY
jgi:hypothetical protein